MKSADWKSYERHPLSAAYPDLEGQTWELLTQRFREYGNVNGRKIVLFEGKVLDCWQLYRAHVQENVEPEFLEMPSGIPAEVFVEIMNDCRRHETAEMVARRVQERRTRVAQSRSQGKSLRTIAEEQNISLGQVQRDLRTSGVSGDTPESDRVTGRDGKSYAAARPSGDYTGQEGSPGVLWDHASGVQPPPEAPVEPDAAPAQPEPAPEEPQIVLDQLGHRVIKRLEPIFTNPLPARTLAAVRKFVEAVKSDRGAYPSYHRPMLFEIWGKLETEMVESMPYTTCDGCGGWGRKQKAPCPTCGQKGFLTQAVYWDSLTEPDHEVG
jgi:hypothetical protein